MDKNITVKIQKGTIFKANITFKANRVPINLTGKTVFFTVKQLNDNSGDDDLALIKKTITVHSDPTNGKTVLELSATDTDINISKYKADFKIFESGSLNSNSDQFIIEIVDVVTKRTS
jgi:hypothetical protein